jgi:hypothetical protein
MNWMRRFAAVVAVTAVALALLPMDNAAAQKWAPPLEALIVPQTVNFYGLHSQVTVEVVVREVPSFMAADFTLTWSNAPDLTVVAYESGPDWGHADMSGAPQVTWGPVLPAGWSVTYANTRFSDPLMMVDRLVLARITFESQSPGVTSGQFTLTVNVSDASGTVTQPLNVPATFTYNIWPAAAVAAQALWPLPDPPLPAVRDHSRIPVQMTDSAGNGIGGPVPTTFVGSYPWPIAFPVMPANGQIRINPIQSGFSWGFGRIPALETRLTNCPAGMTATPHTVRLVGGDVAPLHPQIQGDNKIDILDLTLAASKFDNLNPGTDGNLDGWVDGDVNNDTFVNILDIVVIANNYGKKGPICEACP